MYCLGIKIFSFVMTSLENRPVLFLLVSSLLGYLGLPDFTICLAINVDFKTTINLTLEVVTLKHLAVDVMTGEADYPQ